MKKITILATCLIYAAFALMMSGCMATKQARDVENKGFLVNPEILTKGEGDEALYRYRNPKADWKKYSQIALESVKFAKPEKASAEEVADIQKLASNFNQYLLAELSRDYTIVDLTGKVISPQLVGAARQGGATLKLETAIINPDKSNPTMDVISTLMPIGLGISIIKDFATGKPTSVGEISGEMKFTDSSTGELLAAALDKRVGGKSFSNMFSSWGDANSAMEFWAKKVRYALCMERKDPACEKP